MSYLQSRLRSAQLVSAIVGVTALTTLGLAQGEKPSASPPRLTVPKAVCGPNDHPESGLQGQVPAALRAAGFKGFNCNLDLIGQVKGDGANWQTAEFKDGAHRICGYHGTAFTTAGRTHVGVPVFDLTEPSAPTVT